MNVLSLFDGISCGQIALERAGIKVDKYFASEIKDIAIKVTLSNYPNTIQLGDVRNIKANDLPRIDLLIGGSPCLDFSIANKIRDGLNGRKSSLFYEYLRLLNELKPTYFLLENVKMKKEDQDKISELLGVLPININSSSVAPALRNRYYWTNIPILSLPEKKDISLNDILTEGYSNREKARCLVVSDSRPLTTPIKMFHRFYSSGFTTLIFKDKLHYLDCCDYYNTYYKGMAAVDIPVGETDVFNGVRYLNQTELERCQTVPEGYTKCLTRNEAADVLGDGWTVDVIAHIFGFIR